MTSAQLTEQAAESTNQVSENMRNFLAALKDKQLLAFEASDLEKVLIFKCFKCNSACIIKNILNHYKTISI